MIRFSRFHLLIFLLMTIIRLPSILFSSIFQVWAIEKEIGERGFIDLKHYQVETTEYEILEFFNNSVLLDKADLLDEATSLSFSDNKLDFFSVLVNSYFASVAADFIRHKLLGSGISFTFETVMSSADKVSCP